MTIFLDIFKRFYSRQYLTVQLRVQNSSSKFQSKEYKVLRSSQVSFRKYIRDIGYGMILRYSIT